MSIVYSPEEAAKILGCAPRTIVDLCRSAKLPGLLFGDGGWVLPRVAFEDCINEMARRRASVQAQPTAVDAGA